MLSPMATQITTTYEDPHALNTISTLAVKNLIAPMSDSGESHSLTIGATSNVIIEARGDAKVYLESGKDFQVYHSLFYNFGYGSNQGSNVRADEQILDVSKGSFPDGSTLGTTVNTGSSPMPIWVHGSDASHTTWISSTQVRDLNAYSQFATSQSNGFIINNQATFGSNALFCQDVYMQSTLEVDGNVTMYGNVFSKNLNLWQDNLNGNDRVGFGFSINSNAQLELIKYAMFPDGSSLSKKVAVFGASPFLSTEQKDNPQTFLVFDQLSGIGMHTSSTSSNVNDGIASSGFQFTRLGNVTTSAYLGVGVTEPTVPLDVKGTINCTVLNARDLYCVDITTTSDERLKDIRGNVDASSCLEKIKSLDVIDFSYIESLVGRGARKQTGLRAQQVAGVMADAVIKKQFAGLEDCNMIDTSVILAYLVGAIKELASKIP